MIDAIILYYQCYYLSSWLVPKKEAEQNAHGGSVLRVPSLCGHTLIKTNDKSHWNQIAWVLSPPDPARVT